MLNNKAKQKTRHDLLPTIPIPTAKKNKDTELRCLFKGFEYVLEQKMWKNDDDDGKLE